MNQGIFDVIIKAAVAIWILAMVALLVRIWYLGAEYSPEPSMSREQIKIRKAKNFLINYFIEAIILLAILKIIEAVVNRTINLFILQQAMIVLSLAALLPVIIFISGKPVSAKILKEVPLFAFMGIGMAGAIEILKFSIFTSMEIAIAAVIVIAIIAKWHIFVIKQKDAIGIV